MTRPGPKKNFEPATALESARDVFWHRGYDGTGLTELEATLGIGRKSLYDTFGNKRALYLKALEQYTDTIIERICRGLRDGRGGPLENLDRVLTRLGAHHASTDSRGCLLGVAMGQADPGDTELNIVLRDALGQLADAFEQALAAGQESGAVRRDIDVGDFAQSLTALVQGVALIGRTSGTVSLSAPVVQIMIESLRA